MSCQNDIDLAREQDKNKALDAELKQLMCQNQEKSSSIHHLEDSNEALLSQLEVKDTSIAALQGEINTLRKEYVRREEELVALANAREKALADTRISCDQLQSEKESLKLSLARVEEQVRMSKENEAFAKERLMQVERECVDKLSIMAQGERDAVLAATSDLETRFKLAEERATIAEKNEALANESRRNAEAEASKVRTEAEEKLCEAKEQMKCDYELLLQSKDDEMTALIKSRDADRLQMDDLRSKYLDQEVNHKKEVEGHMNRLDELSCSLHQANSDLKQEKELSTRLSVDLSATTARLDAAEKQHEKDEHAWTQDKAILENKIKLLEEDIDQERSNRQGETLEYRSQQEKARIRVKELQNQLQEIKDRRKNDLISMEVRASSAIKAIFEESRCG